MDEEDREGTVVYRNVRFDVGIPIPGETHVNRAWAEVDNQEVAKVAVGAEFNVVVDFEANNASGGVISAWSVCVTCVDSQRAIWNYGTRNSSLSFPGSKIADAHLRLSEMGDNVMPDRDLVFAIKVFAADGLGPTPAYPATSLW